MFESAILPYKPEMLLRRKYKIELKMYGDRLQLVKLGNHYAKYVIYIP